MYVFLFSEIQEVVVMVEQVPPGEVMDTLEEGEYLTLLTPLEELGMPTT